MLPLPAGREASPGVRASHYVRHRPERTLLYRLVQEYYPAFKARLSAQGVALPGYVERGFEDYLTCGRLEYGFLRVRCGSCHAEHLVAFSCKRRGFCPSCGARRMAESAALLVDEVFPEQPIRQWVLSFPYPLRFLFAAHPDVMGQVLGIVFRTIATHLTKKAGFTRIAARTGAVTLIQRFGGALNLNIHFHMLFLDGVYVDNANGPGNRFQWVKAPTGAELTQLVHTLARRIGRFLERQGLLERDAENSYLAGAALEAGLLDQLLVHSITYRIAVGPQVGRKVFAVRTLPAVDPAERFTETVGKSAGFSLHAGAATKAHERRKLERLCRYVSRPAISEQRLSLTPNGNIRYQLKTPYKDGTTHVLFKPMDFMARLAALVPKPRVNLIRFHGVFAPNSNHRAWVTPAKRGKGNKQPNWLLPPGHGRGSVGPWAGVGRNAARVMQNVSRARPEMSGISRWGQSARPTNAMALAVDRGRIWRLFFLYTAPAGPQNQYLSIFNDTGFTLSAQFDGVLQSFSYYWSSTEYASVPGDAWPFASGNQFNGSKNFELWAVAVRPGDVGAASAVPVPPALWLFGSGLLGMIGIARRNKAASRKAI